MSAPLDIRGSGWNRRSFMKAAVAAGVGALALPYGAALTREQAFAQMQPLGVSFDPTPFPLGVASGDPTAESVILQTRLATDPFSLDRPGGDMPDQVEVGWVVAADPRLRRVVATGTAPADVAMGHAVHVDVTGLEPGRHYWYQFSALGRRSRIGRTKTAGIAPLQRLRIAYVSCQSFPHGYFTAYQNLAREDVDVVFHLGDYMYEYGEGGYGAFRSSPPDTEVSSLESYRVRYAAYRGDPWLRLAHATFPFVVTWDDHEIDNNWAADVPENADGPGQESAEAFALRRFNAFQAYYEHMSIRSTPQGNTPADPRYEIHRRLVFGDLLDVSILDTRQYRTDQPCDDGFFAVNCDEQNDPDATIMGTSQRDWLFDNLSGSQTAWRMVAQQLIVAQVRSGGLPPLGAPDSPTSGQLPPQAPGGTNAYLNADQWDGYLVERQALMRHLADEAIPDTFVITGDIHSHWVFDLKEDHDDIGSPIVGTEFVGTSITSPGFEQVPTGNAGVREALYSQNAHLRWFEGTRKGYAIIDITPDAVTNTYRVVDSITTETSPVSTLAEFVLPRGGEPVQQVAGGDGNPLPPQLMGALQLDRRRFLGGAVAAGAAASLSPYGLRLRDAEAQARPLGVRFDPAPFTVGVASGDPTADSAILWTRLVDEPLLADAHERLPEQVEVSWAVAEDPRMRRVVRSGTTVARRDFAHTVHVDPGGLEPGRWYWYQFAALGRQSRIGRTRTAGGDRLRMAWVGCAKFHIGFFGAYRQLCREDVDLVFCTGDYFYEEPFDPDAATDSREEDVREETETLEQYRRRFALYRGDPALRQAHAMFPWVVTWDDHEFDNNYADEIREDDDGPGQQSDAAFVARRANSYQAYYEMMPIRPPAGLPVGPDFVIHRTIRWGDLLDLFVLDTRQFRTDQPCGDATVTVSCAQQDDPDATILGVDQRQWLLSQLSSSTAAWRTLGQQVLMTAVRVGGLPRPVQDALAPLLGTVDTSDGNYINADQWDGYTVEREAVLGHIAAQGIPDVTVLTGDIHSTWVAQLKPDFDDPLSPSVGVELCGTSITSDGLGEAEQTGLRPLLYTTNPHISYVETTRRGYMTADITADRWEVRLRVIDDVYDPHPAIATHAAFRIERGSAAAVQTAGTPFD